MADPMRFYFLIAALAVAVLPPTPTPAQSASSATQTHPATPFRNNFYRHVCGFNAEGDVSECKLETDFLQIEDDKDNSLLELAVQVARKISGELKDKVDLETLQLVLEQRFFPNGDEGWKSIGKDEGVFLIDRSLVAITVAPDGRISGCDVLERGLRSRAEMKQLCRTGMGARFEADPNGKVRKGRQVSSAFLRAATDEADTRPST